MPDETTATVFMTRCQFTDRLVEDERLMDKTGAYSTFEWAFYFFSGTENVRPFQYTSQGETYDRYKESNESFQDKEQYHPGCG
ncbi:hypothetical protein GCM10007176_01850 [Salinicoccus roseus]|nr:hypothetical protein GCM10007176_01850 [Salinicoccus roseus]